MRTRDLIFPPLLFLLIAGLHNPCFAGSKATVMVSATVMASISQSVLYQERRINITHDDIQRGFVEIPLGTIVQVKTNHKGGYYLHFEGSSELFKEVWVIDKGRTTVLSSIGGLIHQTNFGAKNEVKEISYRFYLSENTQPGLYPWPFSVTASLL